MTTDMLQQDRSMKDNYVSIQWDLSWTMAINRYIASMHRYSKYEGKQWQLIVILYSCVDTVRMRVNNDNL